MSADNEDQGVSVLGNAAAPSSAAVTAASPDALWKRSIANRNRLMTYPHERTVLELCCEYFQWCEENPLLEGKLVTYEGVSSVEQIPKMRAMTLKGLVSFLCIHIDTWGSWRRGDNHKHLQPVVQWAENVIFEQKFSGAAAGLLNCSIIARDLGLAEKSELTGAGGAPLLIQINPVQDGVFFAPDADPNKPDSTEESQT